MKPSNIIYESDASQIAGNAKEVFIPTSIAEISQIVKRSKSITPRGAGTGLAGGAVPTDNTVIDLSKMNRIISFNKARKSIEVEAGIILDELNDSISSSGLEFPVQPSSHEVCTIGGMIATDAVGSRAARYGRTSRWVEWIEVMDSLGHVRRVGKTELGEFAGQEGITGIILSASLRLVEKVNRTASLISVDSLGDIMEIVRELKRDMEVSMIEFIDRDISVLIGLDKTYHIIVEYESDTGQFKGRDYEKLLGLRDRIYPILAQKGYSRIEDPKIFIEKFSDVASWLEERGVPVFGHLSVGIIHPCFSKSQEKFIPELMKLVKKLSGSVSGEHGIGLLKKEFLDKNDRDLVEIVKKRNDPLNKFNPGKII